MRLRCCLLGCIAAAGGERAAGGGWTATRGGERAGCGLPIWPTMLGWISVVSTIFCVVVWIRIVFSPH